MPSRKNPKRILFIDDEPFYASRYVQALEDAGYAVTVETSAGDALMRFEKIRYDVAIVDVMMAENDKLPRSETQGGYRRIIHSLLRPVVAELFTFMEAYLNGIAFDCFHKHHDELSIGDHDLLSEWNSEAKRTRFVPFDQKVFRYPVICARAEGREIDLSGFQQAHRIVQNGKEVRDAITHPSAHYNAGGEQKKVTLLAGLTVAALESLYSDICDYVRHVEEGVGHEVPQSVPWLFDDLGFQYGRDETI